MNETETSANGAQHVDQERGKLSRRLARRAEAIERGWPEGTVREGAREELEEHAGDLRLAVLMLDAAPPREGEEAEPVDLYLVRPYPTSRGWEVFAGEGHAGLGFETARVAGLEPEVVRLYTRPSPAPCGDCARVQGLVEALRPLAAERTAIPDHYPDEMFAFYPALGQAPGGYGEELRVGDVRRARRLLASLTREEPEPGQQPREEESVGPATNGRPPPVPDQCPSELWWI